MKNPIDYFYNEKGDYTVTLHDEPLMISESEACCIALKNTFSSLTMRIDTISKLNERLTKELGCTWLRTIDRPLYRVTESGWECTESGEGEFLAAIPIIVNNEPPSWWIKQCVIIDVAGLCIVTDDEPELAPYDMGDVTHFMKIKEPTL